MNDCGRTRRQALALVALPPGDRELEMAREHARACAGCAQALRDAERMLELVAAELVPSPPSAAALLRAQRSVEQELELDRKAAHPSRAARVVAALATIAAAVTLSGQLVHLTGDARSAALAAGAAAAAAAIAWMGLGRRAVAAAFAACGASTALAALAAASPGVFAAIGVHCLAFELFSAAWPIAAVAAMSGRSRLTPRWTTAALAAAGALAGQAALHLTCPVHTAGPHLFAFHLGGVVLAALAASAIPRAARLAT